MAMYTQYLILLTGYTYVCQRILVYMYLSTGTLSDYLAFA